MGKKMASNGVLVQEPDRFAPTSWGKSKPAETEPYEYTTGSGQLVLIRKIGMSDILRLGLIDNLDFFTKQMASDDPAKKAEAEAQEGNDFVKRLLGNFDKMESTINKIILAGVIAPPLAPVPDADALRKEGVVYVDTIPFNDQVELFGEILDSEGLSDFREESETGVGDVPASESVELPG